MCGIAGIVGKVDEFALRRMTQILHHRGPDDGAIWISKNNDVGLGHRRLSIIDLSAAGRQPMQTNDTRYTLTYNGEIFNYKKLRGELMTKGFSFFSQADSEVLLIGYQYWGMEVLDKIQGQFSFAIWDDVEKKLFAARDRLGIKPFYYRHQNNTFFFASEIKSILLATEEIPSVNWDVLPQYLAFLWVPHPNTLFKNIFKLEPGHYLEIQDNHLAIHRYWDVSFRENFERNEFDTALALKTQLENSTQSQMVSDVPIGLLLSGGLDSTCLLASMTSISKDIRSLTATYARTDRSTDVFEDDFPFAIQAAKHFHVNTKKLTLEAGATSALDDIIWHLDEPLADPSVITNYQLCSEAKAYLTVLLSGMGSDEIFAGYPRHVATIQAHRHRFLFRTASRIIYPLIRNLYFGSGKWNGYMRRIKMLCRSADLSMSQMFLAFSTYYSVDEQARILLHDSEKTVSYDSVYMYHLACLKNSDTITDLNKLLYLDLKTFLPCLNLENMDKTSMAHSVEMRVPFLDEPLFDFTSSIPVRLKLKGSTRKYILRKAFEGIIPEKILTRPKTGFSVPVRKWVKEDLKTMIDDHLHAKQFIERGLFDLKEVDALITQNSIGREDNSLKIWQLLIFDLWMRTFIESKQREPKHAPAQLSRV